MRPRLPSVGFVVVTLTYVSSVAFFAWGLSRPRLDEVWELHHELKVGKHPRLKKKERALLERAMLDHPALGAALLSDGEIGIISKHRDGWIDTPQVNIVRTAKSRSETITLDVQTPTQSIPYVVELRGPFGKRRIDVEKRGRLSIELPPSSGVAELLTLELEGKGLKADPSSLAVRVTFTEPERDPSETSDDDDDDDDDDEDE